jgi:hypothetical protein
VDDTLFVSPNQEYIDDILLKLKAKGLYLNIKEDVAGFLGVHVGKNPNGSIELTQVGLTDRIIGDLGLEQDKSTGKSTPAEYGCLGTNADDKPCDEMFNYQSVVHDAISAWPHQTRHRLCCESVCSVLVQPQTNP